jgi:hypothetical protein
MPNAVFILLGICGIGSGAYQIHQAIQTGAFYGKAGVTYRENRKSLFFWLNLLLRSVLVPGGMWLVWLGLTAQ